MLARVRSEPRQDAGAGFARPFRLGIGLLVAVIAFGLGLAIGRGTAPAVPAPDDQTAAWPGPTEEAHGVPVGYERSRQGAVTAALNYAAVLGDKANLDPDWGRRAYPVFALPGVRDDLLARAQDFAATVPDATALAADPALVLRAGPLGYRLDRYSDEEAVVSVWAVVTGVGTPQFPMTTAWGTERLTLRWVDGDWRVAVIDRDSGPRPPDGAIDPDVAESMRAFAPPRYHSPEEP